MASEALSAKGTQLKRDGNLIAELKKIGSPDSKLDTIDVTSHDSPGAYKEFIPGLLEGGEVAIEGNFIPGDTDGQVALFTDHKSRIVQSFTITLPAGFATEWSFDAIVSNFKCDHPHDDAAKFSATLKVSGEPLMSITYSAGASAMAVSVGTLNPAFDNAVYDYVDPVVTGTSSLTFTVTAASHTITLHSDYDDSDETLTSGVASSAKTLKAAGEITTFTITCKETNKIARVYIVRVSRAAV